MKILEDWVLEHKPRDTQTTALKFIEENLDKKYIFIEAPVGTGKSALGVTLANHLRNNHQKSSYILTPQKILQTQYEQTFKLDDSNYFSTLYGKNNYTCKNFRTTCDIGALTKSKCSNCPHQKAVKTAVDSENVVMNYALAISSFKHTDKFTKRNLLVMDECHQLENILTEYNNLTISKLTCTKHKIPWCNSKHFEDVYNWLCDIFYPTYQDVFNALEEECEELLEKKQLNEKEINLLRAFKDVSELYELLTTFTRQPIDDIAKHYVLAGDDNSIKFKYIFGAKNFHDILEPMADKFLFLSATIFDHNEFCNNLGIPLDETCFISMDSEFDSENRPVLYRPVMKMSYGWDNDANFNNRQNMVNVIKSILDEHKDESGIIHTGNFQIAKWLVNELRNCGHIVLHHNPDSGDNRDQIVKQFLSSKKPTVLISPSITEGLDLVDDLSRFSIFAKISYASLADNWIKHRMEISQRWYLLRALTDVMQGAGRVVRSKDDFGVTYILDASWNHLFSKLQRIIPKWWLNGYHEL